MTEIARSCLLLVPVSRAYEVVADIQRYPEFLPSCEAVSVLQRRQISATVEEVAAQVTVSKAGTTYQFETLNTGTTDQTIDVALQSGPFERLQGEWRFKALGAEGCRVELQLDFVASGLLARLIEPIAQSAADRMVDAFAQRIGTHAVSSDA